MPTVIIAIAVAIIVILSGKTKPGSGDAPPVAGPDAVPGTLAALGAPTVTVSVDGKVQTGKTLVLTANADTIKVSTSWPITNGTAVPYLAGMKLRWTHIRGGLPDDVWAEWLPYFDKSSGLTGLVEDDLLKDTGTPIKVPQAPKMVKVSPGGTHKFVLDLVIPGPRRNAKLAEFWKKHDGAKFKLQPEMVTDFPAPETAGFIDAFLSGGLLGTIGANRPTTDPQTVGNVEGAGVYSLKQVSLSDFMTISFQGQTKGTSKVTIREPRETSYFTGAKIPYNAAVTITGTNVQVVPVVNWAYRVTPEGQDKPAALTRLPNASGEISFSQAGDYEFIADVQATDLYTGHHTSRTFKVVKAPKPQVRITILEPTGGGYQVGKPVSYRARIDGLSFTPPVVWQYRLATASSSPGSTGGWSALGSQLADSFIPLTAGDYIIAVTVNETADYIGDSRSVSIIVAEVPQPVNKFAIGDHVAVSTQNGIINAMDWDVGRASWFYSFKDQFGFDARVAEAALSLYIAPAAVPSESLVDPVTLIPLPEEETEVLFDPVLSAPTVESSFTVDSSLLVDPVTLIALPEEETEVLFDPALETTLSDVALDAFGDQTVSEDLSAEQIDLINSFFAEPDFFDPNFIAE